MGLGGLCRGLNAFVLFLAATLYLILGLALVAAAAATFFTSYGEIFTPLYAGSSIGVGVGIVLVAIVGYCAACRQKACWPGIFMFFDLIVIVVIVAVSVLMFRYEEVLKVAGDVGIESNVNSGLSALNKFETQTIRNVVQNTFGACNGTTTLNETLSPPRFDFSCADDDFDVLGTVVDKCVSTASMSSYNVTFYDCYTANVDVWPMKTPLAKNFDVRELKAVLQSPKGLYCACSSKVMEDFILKYLTVTKWVAIGVAVFFLLVFIACCYLCCCAKKKLKEETKEANIQFSGWSAGGAASNSTVGYGPASGKKASVSKHKQPQGAYIARP